VTAIKFIKTSVLFTGIWTGNSYSRSETQLT